MIELATHFVSRGWPVFPLAPGGKVPVVPRERGGHGCRDASLDLNRVEAWWRDYPDANVGVATGRRSGLLVVDIDPRKTEQWLESVNALALPQTFTVKTWSGGWHLYFTYTFEKRITIGTDLLPGIDWRGEGGYVVAPGSTVEGRLYEIARNLPIIPAPVALIERIEGARRQRREIVSTSRRVGEDGAEHMVIGESRRNDSLMRIGCSIRRWGVELHALLEALRAINADHCEPPLEDAEVRQIAASCVNYPPSSTRISL